MAVKYGVRAETGTVHSMNAACRVGHHDAVSVGQRLMTVMLVLIWVASASQAF